MMKDLSKKILRFNYNSFYPRDYYYDKLVSKYDNPDFFCSLIDKSDNKKLETPTEINFNKNISFGSSIQDIQQELGKPNLIHKKSDAFNYNVMFYRFKIGGHKTKCEFHLLDGHLFFYTYLFSYLSKKDKLELQKIIASKYLEEADAEILDHKIVDHRKNMIIVEDAIDFTVAYLSGDSSTYGKISRGLKKVKSKEDVQVQIKYNELYKCL